MTFACRQWQLSIVMLLLPLFPRFVVADVTSDSIRSETEGATSAKSQQHQDEVKERSTASQQPSVPASQNEQSKEAKEKGRGAAFLVAPLPIASQAIGFGVIPVAAYIYPISKKDKVSEPSVLGVVALFTSNGSRAIGVASQSYFAHNTYRATVAYGRGNLNYDLYGSGSATGLKLPIKQTGQVFQAEFLRNVGWKFLMGPRFRVGSSELTVRSSGSQTPPPPPDLGISTTLLLIGFRVTRDSSRNRFYPTSGSYFTFTSDFYSQTLGSKYSFQSFTTVFSKYWGLGRNSVIAYNGYSCATGGKPPFYGNCIYGANSQLRGYVAGKYFDRYMLTSQVEYRLTLPLRLGVVGFGGIGEAIPGGDQILFSSNSFLPAGGGGLRLLLSKKFHVNLRADIARGKDGHTFSLGVGEAF